MKIHKRLFAFLFVFALVIGLLPSVLADNEPSMAESAEDTLVEFQTGGITSHCTADTIHIGIG